MPQRMLSGQRRAPWYADVTRSAAQASVLRRWWLAAPLLALASLLGIGAACASQSPAEAPNRTNRYIVVTLTNTPLQFPAQAGSTGRHYGGGSYGLAQVAHDEARRVAASYGLRQVASWPIKELAVHCVVYEIPDSRSVAEVLQAVAKDSRVTLAQPLQQFHTLTHQTESPAPAATSPSTPSVRLPSTRAASAKRAPYNDPLYELQTNLVTLGISAAHERSQGAGVRVALIDTGVDSAHPDLRGRVASSSSFVAFAGERRVESLRHGTAMAGLIAAVANNNVGIVGIAPLAQIEVFEACWQLKADADDAACNTFTLARAIAAALEAHVPVINLSLGGPADPLLTALVDTGLKRGVIFVGSMTEEPNSFPTNIQGVIAVSGSEHAHAGATLTAPAAHILTLRPGAQYDFESGTSVAAAEVTGVIALLLGENSHLTANAAVSLLQGSPADAGGQGIMNVGEALAKLGADRGAAGAETRAAAP